MQKFLMSILFLFGFNCALATDFSGTYDCHLTDHSDGPFTATLVLEKDENATFSDGYGSYVVNFHVKGIPYAYTGMAAARGNDLALYFESTGSNKNPDDKRTSLSIYNKVAYAS